MTKIICHSVGVRFPCPAKNHSTTSGAVPSSPGFEDGAVDLFDDHYFHDDDDGQLVVMGSPPSAAEPWPGGLQQPCLCADAGRR